MFACLISIDEKPFKNELIIWPPTGEWILILYYTPYVHIQSEEEWMWPPSQIMLTSNEYSLWPAQKFLPETYVRVRKLRTRAAVDKIKRDSFFFICWNSLNASVQDDGMALNIYEGISINECFNCVWISLIYFIAVLYVRSPSGLCCYAYSLLC